MRLLSNPLFNSAAGLNLSLLYLSGSCACLFEFEPARTGCFRVDSGGAGQSPSTQRVYRLCYRHAPTRHVHIIRVHHVIRLERTPGQTDTDTARSRSTLRRLGHAAIFIDIRLYLPLPSERTFVVAYFTLHYTESRSAHALMSHLVAS
jgi:hypothetical protein